MQAQSAKIQPAAIPKTKAQPRAVPLAVTLFVMGNFFAVQSVHAACPDLRWWEFPTGSTTSTTVKRVNTNRTKNRTIFFCRDYNHRNANHFMLNLGKSELIGSADGTKAIGLGAHSSGNIPLGTGSVTISGSSPSLVNPLNPLDNKLLPIFNANPWNEKGFFHFYIKKGSGACFYDTTLYRKLRNTLRTRANIFTATNGTDTYNASTHTANAWDIGKITNAKLRHSSGNGDYILADLTFFWEQYARSGNPVGGAVAGRYCHFAVAVNMHIKTTGNTLDNAGKAGNYNIQVGVRTQN